MTDQTSGERTMTREEIAAVTDEQVDTACEMLHVEWDAWHESHKIKQRDIMRRVLEQLAPALATLTSEQVKDALQTLDILPTYRYQSLMRRVLEQFAAAPKAALSMPSREWMREKIASDPDLEHDIAAAPKASAPEGEWKADGTRVFLPGGRGGFDLRFCPDARNLAEAIAARMNATAPTPPAAPEAPAVRCFINPMKLSDGRTDYFVTIKCDDREITPYVTRIKGRAEYDLACWKHLFEGGEEPDLMAFDCEDNTESAAAPTPPEGWVMVPKPATDEMHNAARDWSAKRYGQAIGRDASEGCFNAMIAAAPTPPDVTEAVLAEREACAKIAKDRAVLPNDCEALGPVDWETGAIECSLEARGSDCLCQQRIEAAEEIEAAIRARSKEEQK